LHGGLSPCSGSRLRAAGAVRFVPGRPSEPAPGAGWSPLGWTTDLFLDRWPIPIGVPDYPLNGK